MAHGTLVIIPTHNEKGNVAPLSQEILGPLSQLHLLFVDDCSHDGVREEIGVLQEAYPQRVFSLFRSEKMGIGSAYRDGMAWALEKGYDRVVQMDGDGSHDPQSLHQLLAGLERAPMVVGSRYVIGGSSPGFSLPRRLISLWGCRWARFRLGLPVHDLTSGFNGWHCSLLKRLDLRSFLCNHYGFQIELKFRALMLGEPFLEIPIRFKPRTRGVSKLRTADVIGGLRLVGTLARERNV